MRKARLAAVIVIGMSAAGGGVTGCNVGNEPVRTGESVLEFGQLGSGDPFNGSPDQVYLQYWLGSPFDQWGYRGEALVNDARYTSTSATRTGVATTQDPFDLRAVALRDAFKNFVKYQSVHAYWSRTGLGDRARTLATQHEVLLFARDPEEQFQTLSLIRDQGNVPFTEGFRQELVTSRLPDVASLVYPPQVNWNTNPPKVPNPGPVPVLARYATGNFWRNGVTPAGPGAAPFDPDGPGSVKAVHVINHGLCAKQVPYADAVDANGNTTKPGIFSQVGTKFFTAMEKKVAETVDSSAVITLDRSNVVSFIHATTDREDAQHGGFFFNFDLGLRADVNVFLPDLQAFVEMGHAYELKLLDGVLTAEPYRDLVQVSANLSLFGAGPTLQAAFDDALTQSLLVAPSPSASADTLPSVLFQEADKLQEFPGITVLDGVTCVQRAPGDETIPVVPDPTLDPNVACGSMFSSMFTALGAAIQGGVAGQRLGIPASARDQLWKRTALATMVNPHDSGNPADQVYKNFRCVPRESKVNLGTTVNVCRYVLPARRLNVLPDGVELVFVDDDKEYANPAFIPYIIALDKNQTDELCDPPRAQVPGLLDRRPFVAFRYDGKRYSATNCHKVFGQTVCDVVVQ